MSTQRRLAARRDPNPIIPARSVRQSFEHRASVGPTRDTMEVILPILRGVVTLSRENRSFSL
jgi:hypothetical protein